MNLSDLKTQLNLIKQSESKLKNNLLQVTTGTVVGETGDSFRPYKVERTGYHYPIHGAKAIGKYNIGDFVKLDFEDGDRNKPVITGLFGSVQEESTIVDVIPENPGNTSLWIGEREKISIYKNDTLYKEFGTDLDLYYITAMAIDSLGNLIIANRKNLNILVIDKDGGELYETISSFPGSGGANTEGICVGSDYTIYITGYDTLKLYKYNRQYTYVTSYDISSDCPVPEGIVIDNERGILYINTSDDISNSKIQKYDLNGNFLGSLVAGLNFAEGISIDDLGNIYVSTKGAINKYNPSGTLLESYTLPSMGFGNLSFNNITRELYSAENAVIREWDENLNPLPSVIFPTGAYSCINYTGF